MQQLLDSAALNPGGIFSVCREKHIWYSWAPGGGYVICFHVPHLGGRKENVAEISSCSGLT